MKSVRSIFLLSLFSFGLQAQQRHCGYVDKLEALRKADPTMDARLAQIEKQTQQQVNSQGKTTVVVTIPVVFHILYTNTTQNISDAQVQTQMTVLNNDYRRLNADKTNTPSTWSSIAADCEIQFCLAQRDPSNNPTNGIIHKQTTVNQIGNTNKYYQNSQGGDNIWDRNKYLNIWVCDIDGGGTLGFAYPPGATGASDDGVVIDYRYLGTIGTVQAPFDKGRTATHEVGHWFNLKHIWGDDFGNCGGTDNVTDTPNQGDATFGCPNFPKTDNCATSSPGIMFMNYMDYSDDNCMNMFTAGQKTRMTSAINGARVSLLSSQGCVPVGIRESALENSVKIFPNPGTGVFTVSLDGSPLPFTTRVYNLLGELITEVPASGLKSSASFDISNKQNGVYFVEISLEGKAVMKKVTLTK